MSGRTMPSFSRMVRLLKQCTPMPPRPTRARAIVGLRPHPPRVKDPWIPLVWGQGACPLRVWAAPNKGSLIIMRLAGHAGRKSA